MPHDPSREELFQGLSPRICCLCTCTTVSHLYHENVREGMSYELQLLGNTEGVVHTPCASNSACAKSCWRQKPGQKLS